MNRLARLNSDGTLDNSFSIGTGPSGTVNKIKVLPNGKMFVIGSISTYNGQDSDFIVKLNANGTKDNSFNITHNSNVSSPANDLFVLPNGQILLVGTIIDFNGTGIRSLVKLNANGSQDTSFNQGTGFNASIKAIDVQSDGKIIVGGSFTEYNNVNIEFLARLNPDGSLDPTFNSGELGPSGEVSAIKVLEDDRIIIGGSPSYNNLSANDLILLNADGTIGMNFNFAISTPHQIEVQSDGKFVVVGIRTTQNGGTPRTVARYNSDGTLDADFMSSVGTGASATLNTLAIQNDGRILIGGNFNFTNFNGTSVSRITRINGENVLSVSDINTLNNATKIYPNPTYNSLSISSEIQFTDYKIFSLDGKEIQKGKINDSLNIPVYSLKTGIYIVKLKNKSVVKNIRFVKE
jgi:uncharacterized delta-60 repeat protein